MIRTSLVQTRSCDSLKLTADTAGHSVLDKLRKITMLSWIINIQIKLKLHWSSTSALEENFQEFLFWYVKHRLSIYQITGRLIWYPPTHPKLDHIGMIGRIKHLGQSFGCLVEGLQNKSHSRRNIKETQVQVIVLDQNGESNWPNFANDKLPSWTTVWIRFKEREQLW